MKYKIPRCVAELPGGRLCGADMRVMAEREPSFGPNWKPGHCVFQCKYCGSIRAIDLEHPERYAERR